MEYQILYAFLADVGYTEGYSEPYVGPCHLLNLDMTAIKLVWKYTKRNSNFRRETPSAFVTTTLSHRKLRFLFCEIYSLPIQKYAEVKFKHLELNFISMPH